MEAEIPSLKLPIDTKYFFRSLSLQKCSLEESIASHIHIILTTSFGECKFDENYGCEIWESEFEHSQISKIWIDKMALNIQSNLENYESRIHKTKIEAQIKEVELENRVSDKQMVRLQKCLIIKVKAKLVETNEDFYFSDKIFISPFAID